MKSESDGVERICVLSGIHRGAVIPVADRPVLIGDGGDCDALLSDSSVTGSAIRLSRDPRGRLSVTAVRGDVRRNGRSIPLDRPSLLRDGVAIALGDVRIAAGNDPSGAQNSVNQRDRRRTLLSWGGACVASLALLGFLGGVGGPADAYNAAHVQARAMSDSAIKRDYTDPIPALDREIARQNLTDRVVVERTISGQIVARGIVSAQEYARWNDTVRWFDGRFGDRAVLESKVSQGSDGIVLPFEIVSILSTPNPKLVIQNGNTFPIGSILPGGWEVREIADMTVVLARGDRELAITF